MKKTEKMERGRMVVESGRDDSDYNAGTARSVGESDKSRNPGYSMGKSMGGMGKGALTKGY